MATTIKRVNGRSDLTRHYIREWRKFRKLTQEKLAEKADMSASSISQIETYKQGFTDETLAALAVALECRTGDLMSHDPNSSEFQLILRFREMAPAKQSQALKIIQALD